jgi:hypothetical protein
MNAHVADAREELLQQQPAACQKHMQVAGLRQALAWNGGGGKRSRSTSVTCTKWSVNTRPASGHRGPIKSTPVITTPRPLRYFELKANCPDAPATSREGE